MLSVVALFMSAAITVGIAVKMYQGRVESPIGASDLGTYKKAVLTTDEGDIEVTFNQKSPLAIVNFVKLAKSEFYDGTNFHRVIDNLLIEGGDPLSKRDDLKSKWGNGGPGYVYKTETDPGDKIVRGVVAIVNNGTDTNGSQFFVLTRDADWLKGQNTILGWVTKGMEVVDRISKVPTGVTKIPISNVSLTKVTLE